MHFYGLSLNYEGIQRVFRFSLPYVKSQWKDEDLEEEVNMYGEMWKKGTVLSVLMKHQAHHCGQLTILMRLEGHKVQGVYGPSKEEWQLMNMPSPE